MLSIRNLSKIYANGVHALANINLQIAQGEIIAIVGGSGCGKSTLLRLIAGLDLATGGEIQIDGERIAAPHPAIGMVFQEPRLLPWLTVEKNIAFGIDQLPKEEQTRRVEQALRLIGLDGYGQRLPKELSGGQAQRVAIARALVAQPKALLMDEPFSALDPMTRHDLHGQVIDLWKAYKPTMVMVTHDAEEAVALADRVIVMAPKPGRVSDEILIVSGRPRDRMEDSFEMAKRRVLSALDEAMAPGGRAPSDKVAAGAGSWW
ncbi:MAG: ABC transporter ATP-binding protein [Beijerinckiaceae bacterium]